MKEFAKKYPLVFGVAAFAIMYAGVRLGPHNPTPVQEGLLKMGLSVLMVLVMWPAVSNRWLKFPGEGWKFAFGISKWFLIAQTIYIGLILITIVIAATSPELSALMGEKMGGEGLQLEAGSILVNLLAIAFECVFIGISEELAFRRALFDMGMLQFPKMKNRALVIALISSFIFGFVHVANNLSSDWLAVTTAILKTLASGTFGFILCAAALEGQNIWSVAAVHALNDFIPLTLTAVMANAPTGGGYVQSAASGANPILAIVPQVVLLLVYIPSVKQAVKTLKKYDEQADTCAAE